MLIRAVILTVIFLVMLLFTISGYSQLCRFLFAGGSMESMMDFAAAPAAVPAIFLLLFTLVAILYLRKRKKAKIIQLCAILLLWLLSGRNVATIMFPDGRISSGWFCIETHRFYLCNNKADCETVTDYHTKTENLPFWRIRIKNEHIDEIIFAGPFVWKKTQALVSKFGHGTCTH